MDTPDAATRLALLRLAIEDLPFARVDDEEFHREGASYTVETLRAMKKRYPNDELFLCMGTDMLLSFDSWYHPKEICSLCQVVMAHRTDIDEAALADFSQTFVSAMERPPFSSPTIFWRFPRPRCAACSFSAVRRTS